MKSELNKMTWPIYTVYQKILKGGPYFVTGRGVKTCFANFKHVFFDYVTFRATKTKMIIQQQSNKVNRYTLFFIYKK
jgi:hypothetical protein